MSESFLIGLFLARNGSPRLRFPYVFRLIYGGNVVSPKGATTLVEKMGIFCLLFGFSRNLSAWLAGERFGVNRKNRQKWPFFSVV